MDVLKFSNVQCIRVHYNNAMKNITLSADETLIEQARMQARSRKTTLNQLFREWLQEVADSERRTREVDALLERLEAVDSGGSFSRETMNER